MGRLKGTQNGDFISKVCFQCKTNFECHSNVRIYCSRKCYTDSKRKVIEKKCIECGSNFISATQNGRWRNRDRKFCARKCAAINNAKNKVGHPGPWAGKKRPDMYWFKGSNHHNWKGGITPLNKVLRKSIEYKNWRTAVFERDDFTCQFCSARGGILHPHHIRPFAIFPALRFEVANGITLCENCHKETPTFGNKHSTIYPIKAETNPIKPWIKI